MLSLLLHILGCRGRHSNRCWTARECSCLAVSGLAQHGRMYHSYGSRLAIAWIEYSCTASGCVVDMSKLADVCLRPHMSFLDAPATTPPCLSAFEETIPLSWVQVRVKKSWKRNLLQRPCSRRWYIRMRAGGGATHTYRDSKKSVITHPWLLNMYKPFTSRLYFHSLFHLWYRLSEYGRACRTDLVYKSRVKILIKKEVVLQSYA
jgi:hypothetical protein